MQNHAERAPDRPADPRRRLVHVRELDGIRGIAALMVFFHHVLYTSISPAGWGTGVVLLWRIWHYGETGVDLFFVLSGFLITSLLIEDRASPRYYHDFYWKRALRILPLYAVCLILTGVLYSSSGSYIVLSTIFLANFAALFHVASSGPFWTLAIEEQFYLLWPTIVRRRRVEQIGHWAVAIGIGAVVLRLAAAMFGHHNYVFTFFRCDGLAAGAWLAYRFRRSERLGLETKKGKTLWVAGVLLAAVLILVSSAVPDASLAGQAFSAALLQTAVTLIAGAMVSVLIAFRNTPPLAIFRSGFLTFFGLISYAMYMTHSFVRDVYDSVQGPLTPGHVQAYVLRFFIILVITIAICLISRYALELPAASLRKHVLSPATKRPAEIETPIG